MNGAAGPSGGSPLRGSTVSKGATLVLEPLFDGNGLIFTAPASSVLGAAVDGLSRRAWRRGT